MKLTGRFTSDNSIDLQDNEIYREASSHVKCDSMSRENDIQYFNTEPRSKNPVEWTRDDVSVWLRQYNLEKLIHTFQENDIDGLILMSDEFDQSLIKDLIPTLRDRVLFNIARKSLKFKYEKIPSDHTIENQINVNQRSIITQFLYTLNRMVDYITNKTRFYFSSTNCQLLQPISITDSRCWNTFKRIYSQHIVPNILRMSQNDTWRKTAKFWHNKIIFIIMISLLLALLNHYHLRKITRTQLSRKLISEKHFDLYNDDGVPLKCPSYTRFDFNNRRHFVVMIVSSLERHIWKNFLGFLCSGIDVYIMLDKNFFTNSSSRVDAKPNLERSAKSYSHRFLFISNEELQQNGVSYMNKLPRIQFTAWDRTVAWLYKLSNFSTVWLIEQDVQWYHPNNMTKLFNLFISNETDILCANIVPNNSSWDHWPGTKSDIFPNIYWTGSFSPLVRWSYRLVRSHYQYMRLIHQNRLKTEFDFDFRFQEFIFATIATMENFTLGVYKHYDFLDIGLGIFNDHDIIQKILEGKHILHRVKHNSILTKYKPDELLRIIQTNYTKIIKT